MAGHGCTRTLTQLIFMSTPAPQTSTTGSRSRPQARKKPNDNASYFGPALGGFGAAGTKRHATDKVEGEPRGKRKRIEPATRRDVVEHEPRASLVEFVKMPMHVLYRYLTQFDIIPPVWPSPLSIEDPPQPSFLENPYRHTSRAPSPLPMTPANRPRRESKEQNRRRSSRLIEEEPRSRPPILADVEELHVVLAWHRLCAPWKSRREAG